MTRPKVLPENRQRTAQACLSCKRRKQKCNGLCPCNTCSKRNFTCTYGDRDDAPSPSDTSAPKKRHLEARESLESSRSVEPTPPSKDHHVFQTPRRESHEEKPHRLQQPQRPPDVVSQALRPAPTNEVHYPSAPQMSRNPTTQSGPDEEALVYSQTRMLQDPTGRLLYVGDSASLSFLQLLRMMVESVAGPSPFTEDPRRHKIQEAQFTVPPTARQTHLLPDKTTAIILADAYFTNTLGMLRIFRRDAFFNMVDRCYMDPLAIESHWVCLLNLVLAIGLMLATPVPGTEEALIVGRLRSDSMDRAELFYLNARSLHDPMTGLEDADFWSVKALLLLSLYMLAKAKRNTAWAYLGMAIRSAYALGLHREETMEIFGPEERACRRDVWRSLFVFDRFISCSLGRPTAIDEGDCSGDILQPEDPENVEQKVKISSYEEASVYALAASVRSCAAIGTILSKVYQKRRVTTRLAQEIADVCKIWPKALAPFLHWGQAAAAAASQGMAILHVNLFYCHSIVLLTRPFFLWILNSEIQDTINSQRSAGSPIKRRYARMEKFGEACVIASAHTTVLVQNAFEAGYLPRHDPFVLYFLSAAALVLLANEFAGLYYNGVADQQIANTIAITTYCAELDPQASRLLYIISTFWDCVHQQRARRQSQNPGQPLSGIPAAGQPQTSSPFGANTHTGTTPLPSMRLHPGAMATYSSNPPTPKLGTNVPAEMGSSSVNNPQASFKPSYLASPAATLPLVNSPRPQLTSPSMGQQRSPQVPGLVPERHISLSSLLDLSALDQPSKDSSHLSEESSGPEDGIDFDALWAWPSNTPAQGSPKFVGMGGTGMGPTGAGIPAFSGNGGAGGPVGAGATPTEIMQGVSDSHVPLFGVEDERA